MTHALTVVVPSFNTRDLTVQCVESVVTHTRALDYELVVVDNASQDGSADELERRFPGIAVQRNTENLGFGPAVNQALRRSRAPFVALLNSDTYLTDDALTLMVRCAKADELIGALGCRTRNADGSHQPSAGRFPALWLEVSDQFLRPVSWLPSGVRRNCVFATDFSEPRDVDWVAGSCLLLRRKAVDHVGLFDEQFTFGEEDIDLGWRLKRAGWRVVYIPRPSVVHLGGRSRQFNPRSAEHFFEGRYRLYQKHRGRAAARSYRRIILASIAVRWAAAELHRRIAPAGREAGLNPYAAVWLGVRRW